MSTKKSTQKPVKKTTAKKPTAKKAKSIVHAECQTPKKSIAVR